MTLAKTYGGLILLLMAVLGLTNCNKPSDFTENFNEINDRIWVSSDFWTIPIENWQINGGRLECMGEKNNMKTILLSHLLSEAGEFLINLRMGLLNQGDQTGSGGLILGIQDDTDSDIRSLAYFGKGVNAGVDSDRQIFIGEISKSLPEGFDLNDFTLHIDGLHKDGKVIIRLQATDENGLTTSILEKDDLESFAGAIAIVNHHPGGKEYTGNTRFWFDDLNLSGSALSYQPDNRFGPILWSMYTLSKNVLKLSAQMPPIGMDDNQWLELYFREGDNWEIHSSEKIKSDSRTALFKITDWKSDASKAYRLVYHEKTKSGDTISHLREGIIRKDPIDKPLVLGGLTCQYHYGFPYRPLVENLTISDPDLLYFSGDQLYEGNGGYGIVRFPADTAILNYLGKWYMFGWAFGNVMRDRPTIAIPDDHDVFQGNLWGEGGRKIEFDTFRKLSGTSGGYVEPAEMVNVVHQTQCSHLPDPYDPTQMDQGILPYYTELIYGDVSFAVVGDRMYKSGPAEVAFWEGRTDHMKNPLNDLSKLDPPGLTLLGDRQLSFLKNWAQDWESAKMKCLLSQTIFTNVATHHGGEKMVLLADLDSGAWPITPRNNAVEVLRSCFAFHVSGDQHLPSLVQYGIENFKDGSWAFCTPAITVGYQRRFKPEELGWVIENRPAHNLPNTGEYRDPFGHPSYVYAIGNPKEETRDPNRYQRAQNCSSGYGLIHFDQNNRTIKVEAIRFLADLDHPQQPDNQFPGWPVTINQTDNYGRNKIGLLPAVSLDPELEYVQLFNEKRGQFVYALRPKDSIFEPFVFETGSYTLRLVNTETGNIKETKGLVIK